MNKLTIIAVASLLCIANDGGCTGGGVNSASVAHACHTASNVGTAIDILARDLAAAGFSSAKINAALPLIQAGKLVVDVNCALLVPTPAT